jgi:hypothetical protein
MPRSRFRLHALAIALAIAAAAPTRADTQYAQTTSDGLVLRRTLEHGAVYVKPGASVSQYHSVGLMGCYVAFAKGWATNYNANEPDLSMQVTPDDEKRIKSGLSEEFNRVFVQQLEKGGAFTVVTKVAPGVLILRPSLLNVIVTAPTVDSPSPSADIVASAGQMTLYLELWDGPSATLLARIIDTDADQGAGGMGEQADTATNRAAADRILQSWAERLRKGLDAAREASGKSD